MASWSTIVPLEGTKELTGKKAEFQTIVVHFRVCLLTLTWEQTHKLGTTGLTWRLDASMPFAADTLVELCLTTDADLTNNQILEK